MKRKLLTLFFMIPILLLGQEICDNGIDDDGDGDVDINDTECECLTDLPSSLIPNPSFEDMNCCPFDESQLECADSWVQASIPTTDYVHTCGVLGNPFLGKNAPLPFPDGEGGIGFRDGKPGNSNFKEYAGACLTLPMEVGIEYRLDFFVGFPEDGGISTDLDITLFATTNCGNLPFGQAGNNVGCPLNDNGWVQISSTAVSGRDEWVNVVFEFEADQPYSAIVLGPPCGAHPRFIQDPYFFMDRLNLNEKREFGIPFNEIEGDPCSENGVTLFIEPTPDFNYQWYYEGAAIVGAADNELTIDISSNPEGAYSVIVQSPEGCFRSQSYDLAIPLLGSVKNESICEGEFFEENGEQVTTEGQHVFTYQTGANCDSTVVLNLEILKHTSELIVETICEGEGYEVLGDMITSEGIFEFETRNVVGCDSTIMLDLTVVPANEGIELIDTISVELGDLLSVEPSWFDPDIENFSWTDQEGNLLGTEPELSDLQLVKSDVLTLVGIDQNGCVAEEELEVRVTKFVSLYIPNIFTPESNDLQSFFQIYASRSVKQLSEVMIFDRWGELVYSIEDTGPLSTYIGWDGRFQGEMSAVGVYTYMVVAEILDGTIEQYTGTVTLIR